MIDMIIEPGINHTNFMMKLNDAIAGIHPKMPIQTQSIRLKSFLHNLYRNVFIISLQ